MEMNNEIVNMEERSDREPRGGQVLIGLALMLLGVAFLFDQMDWWNVHLSRHFWPFFLLFFGVARMLAGPRRTRRGRVVRSGMWMIYIGMWGLISEYRVFGLDYDTSWPLLIVAAGLNMVWRSFETTRLRGTQEN